MATTLGFLLRPLCISTASAILSKYPLCRTTHVSSFSGTPLVFSHSLSSSLAPPRAVTSKVSLRLLQVEEQLEEEEEEEEEVDQDIDIEIQESVAEEVYEETENLGKEDRKSSFSGKEDRKSSFSGKEAKLPTLTVKEKKELASYAHSLGKKLKCQLVGKSGVTQNVVSAFIENLESNELLKIKIHGTCPGELEDVVKQLEQATGSVVVDQIGRTIIIYRPSLTKLKLEEKRKQARRFFLRKGSKFEPALQKNAQVGRLSRRGRWGSSRAEL